jgi:uncharacterized protein (TIGR02147 family)
MNGEKGGASPQVYDYADYRLFLRDTYRYRKEINARFSYAVFARICGFRSSGMLRYVMCGRRNLTANSAFRIAQGLGLDLKSASYFLTLVFMGQSRSPNELACFELWRKLLLLARLRLDESPDKTPRPS